MRHPRVLSLLVGLALVGAACSSSDDDGPDTDDTTTTAAGADEAGVGPNGFVPDPISWDECGPMQCATVTVPIDYDDVAGERLTLAVARQQATGDREGAIFVNPGGPGASAVQFAQLLPLVLPGSITEHFDIVGVDPRGVGQSSPIDCGVDAAELYGVDPTLEDEGDRIALLDLSQDYVDGCAADAVEVLPHLGTRDVARDMDAVRAAMGDATLSYVGASYGTAIGQVYAELFPTRIRSMVLDAVLELGPSGLELAASQADGFEQALDRFVEHCTIVGDCRTSADPRRALDEVVALAEQGEGIPAPGADRPAGPGELNVGIAHALYSQSLWDDLDDAVADALAGDGTAMVRLADGYLGIGSFDIYFAVNCIDFAWPSGDPDAFLEAGKAAAVHAPHFGEAIVTDYVRCAYWPAPPVPLTPVSAPGAPPILVISTTGDPATPYEAGVAVAERLESGVLLTHEGDGHGVIGSGDSCVDALLAAYLLDGAVPEDGTVCS